MLRGPARWFVRLGPWPWGLAVAALVACQPSSPPDTTPDASVLQADPASSTATVDRTSGVVADGADRVNVQVTLRDAGGKPVGDQVVQLEATGGGNLFSPPVRSDSSGNAAATLRSTVAEQKTLRVVVNPGTSGSFTLTLKEPVTFVPGPPGVASTLAASPPRARADGASPIEVTLTARDSYGNPISGQAVIFTATGLGNTLSLTSGMTDNAGVLRTTVTSTRAGAKDFTAKLGAYTVSTSLVFNAGAPDSGQTVLTVAPSPVVADGSATATVSVTVKDVNGEHVIGEHVTLTVSGTGNVLSTASGVTDDQGVFTAALASTKAEMKTVTATVASFQKQQQVPFIAGPAARTHSSLSVNPSTLSTDQTTSVQVLIRDAYDNPVAGEGVSLGSVPTGATFVPTGGVTDASGGFSATFASGAVGLVQVTATTSGFALTQNVNLTAGAPSATYSALDTDRATATANDSDLIWFSVSLADARGNRIPNLPVAWSASGTAGTYTLAPSGPTTNLQGEATASLRSRRAGAITVTLSASTLSLQATVTFLAGPPHQPGSTLTLTPSSISTEGETSAVQVTLRDVLGNPVPGATVSLTATGSSNTWTTAPSGSTDAQGQLTASIKSTAAEDKQLLADVGGAFSLGGTLHVVPGAPSASRSTLTPIPASAVANNSDSVMLEVSVKDAHGNPIPSQAVSWSATGSGNTLAPAASSTDATGTATATLRTSAAGQKTVTVTAGALSLQTSVTFLPGAPAALTSTVVATPASQVADGTATSLTVTLRDANGNPVPDQAVSLFVSGSSNTLSPVSGTTNSSGVLTATLSSTKAESKTVTAVFGGLTAQTTVTFVAGPPVQARCSLVASPASVQAGDTTTLTVTVLDQNNNPVANEPVLLSTTGTANTLTPASGNTDASGQLSASLRSTKAEGKTVTATIRSFNLTEGVTFVPGMVSSTGSTISASPTSVPAGDGDTATVTVTTRDAYGNPVPSVAVVLSGSGTGNTLSPASGLSNSSGVFQATWASASVQQKTLTASVASFTLSTQVTFVVAPPKVVSLTSTGTAGCITLTYGLHQAQGMPTDVLLEFSGAGRAGRMAQAGNTTAHGVLRLSASSAAGGTAHSFLWNSSRDLPRTESNSTIVRVTPVLNGVAGQPFERNIQVLNHFQASPQTSTSLPAEARSAAAGDFNRDGRVDVVAAIPSSSRVSTYLGNGTGGFTGVGSTVVLPSSPLWLTTGDFNRDGSLDVATANSNGSVSTLLGSPTGALSLTDTFPAGTNLTFLVAEDVTGDGVLDLLVASGGASSGFTVWRGLGNGGFSLGQSHPTGPNTSWLALADVDRDGKVDALAANSTDVTVHRGNGNGTFNAPTAIGTVYTPGFVVAADFNRDGKVDLATGDGYFHAGQGDGSFAYPVGDSAYGSSAVAADFDGDGFLDLATGNSSYIRFNLGNGSGYFGYNVQSNTGAPVRAITPADFNGDGRLEVASAGGATPGTGFLKVHLNGQAPACEQRLAAPTRWWMGSLTSHVVAADLNQDGKPDAISGDSGTVTVRLGRGNSTFQANTQYSVGWAYAGVVPGDFDQDGFVDIATGGSGQVVVLRGNGTGALIAPGVATLLGPVIVEDIATGDFNGDGKLDIAAALFESGVDVVLGVGSASFGAPTMLGTPGITWGVASGDVNQDGKLDIVAVGNGGFSNTLLGNGDGTFRPPLSHDVGFNPYKVALADMNGDGKLDMLVSTGSQVAVALGRGDGTYQASNFVGVPGSAFKPAGVDVTGDGIPDLVVSLEDTDRLAVLPGVGDGTFQAAVLYDVGDAPRGAAFADFDADGRGDVAVATSSHGGVTLLRGGAAGGALEAAGSPAAGASPEPVAVGDFDRDGVLDVVTGGGGATGNSVRLLLGNGDGSFKPATSFTVAGPPKSIAVGDFNRDGRLDVATALQSGNAVAALLGNGNGTFQAPLHHTVSAPRALVAGDWNRDGLIDLAIAYAGSSAVGVMRGNGDGTFQSPVDTALAGFPTALVGGDWDRDGFPDLAVVNGDISTLRGLGDGTFTPISQITGGSATVAIASADLNRDAKADLVVANNGSLDAPAHLGAGDGTFTWASVNPAGAYPTAVSPADLDFDGMPDLLLTLHTSNALLTFRALGGGTFDTPIWYGTGARPLSVATGDFDRDGLLDVVTANLDSGSLTILRSQ